MNVFAFGIRECKPLVAPRHFTAGFLGAGGEGFPHSVEKYYKKLRGNPQSCATVEPYSRFVWANSVKVIPPLLILDGPIIIDSRFRSCIESRSTNQNCPFQKSHRPTRRKSDRVAILQ